MKSSIIAVALSVAFAGPAFAQSAPAPAPKADCCEKMKADATPDCCKDMHKKDHAEHDMKDGGKSGSDHKH